MKSPARVTVLVLNRDEKDMLAKALESLRQQSYGQFETVVIDNGSTDGSVELVRARFPEVRVLAFSRNLGFAEAVNEGIKASDGEFVALLNNDMELDPRWLEELVEALDEDPRAGSVGGKILSAMDHGILDGAGDVMTWYGTADRRGHGEPDRGQYDSPQPVFSACAGAALYRREALRVVGLFDEDFFAYLEDLDWGFRAQLAGYGCNYVPDAVAYHVGSASWNKMQRKALYLRNRNRLAMVVKDYPPAALVRHGPKVVLHELKKLKNAAGEGEIGLLISAWMGAIRLLPRMLGKRRRIQRTRRATYRDLNLVVWSRHSQPEDSRAV